MPASTTWAAWPPMPVPKSAGRRRCARPATNAVAPGPRPALRPTPTPAKRTFVRRNYSKLKVTSKAKVIYEARNRGLMAQ